LVAGRWRVAFRILRWQGGPLGESGRTAEWTGAESPSSLERRAWRAVEESVPGFDRVTLGFLTPTAFRRTGATRWNATNPLPAPHLVWGSLQRRWRSAFPDDPAAEWSPEWMDRHLALGRFEVRSAMMAFERHEGKVPGFLGEVEYQFHRELTAAERVRLWMWSEFARYAGVGTMTAWGMGQTLRVGGIK
jgi:CRISPR/Cas system endoribonuclease Cas6 (RAMP superfamily)